MTAIEHAAPARSARTPLYAYGVVRAGGTAPASGGVLGGHVELVTAGPVAALVSPLTDERVRAKRRDLLAHSDVLQAALAEGVVLPLRFGTVFRNADDLVTSFLEPRRDELQALLQRFDGLREMRLRVRYQDEESVLRAVVAGDGDVARLRAAATGPGGQARLVQLGELVASRYAARRASDADAIVRRLAEHAVEVRRDDPDDELGVVTASFLLRDADRARFDEVLDSVALVSRELMQFICTGPLPPHSFIALSYEQAA